MRQSYNVSTQKYITFFLEEQLVALDGRREANWEPNQNQPPA
jgi:hypothetical protein